MCTAKSLFKYIKIVTILKTVTLLEFRNMKGDKLMQESRNSSRVSIKVNGKIIRLIRCLLRVPIKHFVNQIRRKRTHSIQVIPKIKKKEIMTKI